MSILWPDKNARAIARLFRDDPEGWKCDEFYARHRRAGIEIWAANGSFALSVKTDHGPTLYGLFFPIGTASQIHIWNAFKRWRHSAIARRLEALA